HDDYRIALYYAYIELTPSEIQSHMNIQKQICDELNLKGRIRISKEGVNGVLSGELISLQKYEELISKNIQQIIVINNNSNNKSTIIALDVKYCQLRKELPIQDQLFDRLLIKETKTVISLFDQSFEKKKESKKDRYRHEKKSIEIKSSPPYLDLQSLHNAVMEESLKPARHLSANEWNKKLDEAGLSSSSNSNSSSALLLDVRNVYEMRVGHFVHPTTPTLLTNTRKYSDLPQLIASNKEIKEREQIFMYCTGGVRCERVSMLVRELYPDKQIYQLRGGIQKYIQTFKNENNSTTSTNSYFAGKNFVFDPRRTDPIHFGETIGRCLVCDLPHDDYDNGHAPSENKEARCNKCRMLVLICNDCRPKYRCHNEKEKE
ncbi:hypothetical protein FRACYDRAFT_148425, partial [Fragilariopsis cylindrus CCMP1102]